jgi:hypothetical protein
MERMLLGMLEPGAIIARGSDSTWMDRICHPVMRASTDVSDHPLRHRALAYRCESAQHSIHFTPARAQSRHGSGSESNANLSLYRRRFHTLTPHHQTFTRKMWWLSEQALASMLAATQTVIANHYTSGVACGAYDRDRRRSTNSACPHSWHRKPRMNDLGTWAEL